MNSKLLLPAIFMIISMTFCNKAENGLDRNKLISDQEKTWKAWLRNNPPAPGSIQLNKIFSFPNDELLDKGHYLWESVQIRHLSEKLFVVDSKANKIFSFTPSGDLLKVFGKKGEGPGEFLWPQCVMAIEDKIIIYDAGNRRIQFFNDAFEYEKSFKLFKGYDQIIADGEGLIFAAPYRQDPSSQLIDVLNPAGRLLYSFGEPKLFSTSWNQLNMLKLSFNKHGELLVGFRYFPLVRRYSKKGELISEHRIESDIVLLKEKMNLQEIHRDTKETGIRRRGLAEIIVSICAIGDLFYVLHYGPRIDIFEFDYSGKRNDLYIEKTTFEYTVEDFFVLDMNGSRLFYLLRGKEDNKVEVFKFNH